MSIEAPTPFHRQARRVAPILVCLMLLGALFPKAFAQITAGAGYTVKRLAGDNDLGQHFSIARVGNDGNGFFYFADRQVLYAAICTGGDCRMEGAPLTSANRGQFVSSANLPGAANRPLVAYYDANTQDLRAGICSSSSVSGCRGFTADRALDTGGDVGQYTAMAVNPATGFAVISYYFATAGFGDARIYVCSNADCSAGSTANIDTNGDVGRNSAIAFGANLANFTNLFVVHDNLSTGQIRFLRATAPFSSFGGIDLGAGSDAAISVGSSGFPDIVYRGADDRLVHVRCLSFDCTGVNQVIQTLASPGKGFAPSITHMPNGNVFVTAQEQASGSLFGYLCNDAVCASPQVLTIETGPNLGDVSMALSFSDNRPLVLYQDSFAKDVRTAECASAACAQIRRRISANGTADTMGNFALRNDGRAVAIWLRDRSPMFGVCSDLPCSTVTERGTGGGNTDVRPAITIRPDGRPFAYYTSFGGTAAWDCADADCTSGTSRFVSGDGNSTSNISELALRSDGIPVMLYYRNTTFEVFLYVCGDTNCTTGTTRRLITEPAASTNFLIAFALEIGADNRAIVSYLRTSNNFSLTERRLLRCVDADCTSATALSLATQPQTASATPFALQGNGAPGFVETSSNRLLVRCNDADCASLVSTTLPVGSFSIQSLRFKQGNVPVVDAGVTNNTGGYHECSDVNCTSAPFTSVIAGTASTPTNFSGRLQLSAANQPVEIFDEGLAQDVWLAIPVSDNIFRSGFE